MLNQVNGPPRCQFSAQPPEPDPTGRTEASPAMGMAGQTLSAGSHASVHSVGSYSPRRPQIPLRSGVKPRRYLGLFMVKRTHVESLLLLPRGYDPRYCCPTALLHSIVGLGVGSFEER